MNASGTGPVPDLYVAAGADGTAGVCLSDPSLPADGGDMRWQVTSGGAVVASGTFAGGAVTLDAGGAGGGDYQAVAFADANGDGVPDAGEPTRQVNVHVVRLDSLAVTASADSGDTVTAGDGRAQAVYLQKTGTTAPADGQAPYADFVDPGRAAQGGIPLKALFLDRAVVMVGTQLMTLLTGECRSARQCIGKRLPLYGSALNLMGGGLTLRVIRQDNRQFGLEWSLVICLIAPLLFLL